MGKKKSNDKALLAGTDYIIVASPDGGGTMIVPKTEMKEVSADLVLGGFHTLCADVGEIPGHPLSGYRAGDILHGSLWNLTHRAACPDNSGMVYDPYSDIWVGIYLVSDALRKITNLSCDDFVALAGKQGKRLLSHDEFSSAAEGSNELTNSKGSRRPDVTGGNVDSLGRRMISNIGCEDCCGVLWQWLSSTDPADADYILLAGGDWYNGADCGSRSRIASSYRWNTYSSVGARFASEPLHKRGARTR